MAGGEAALGCGEVFFFVCFKRCFERVLVLRCFKYLFDFERP